MYSVGGGGYSGIGLGAGLTGTATNASQIHELTGRGVQGGLRAGAGAVLSAEYVGGSTYRGISGGGNVEGMLPPLVVVGSGTYTVPVFIINPAAFVRSLLP